jgi:hypothetical protein
MSSALLSILLHSLQQKNTQTSREIQQHVMFILIQLGTRNFGHHFCVTSKNCDVNHSLLSTWHSNVKFWNLFSVHGNRMSIFEVNNVKPILHFLTVYWQWCPKFRVSNCTSACRHFSDGNQTVCSTLKK